MLELKPQIMIKKSILLSALVVFIGSCDRIDELTMFDVEYTTSFTIPSSSIIDLPFDITTPETTTNSEATFENNDTRSDLVESVKLRELRLDLTAPSDGDFNFLNEIEIFINAEGLPEVLIASDLNIEPNGLQSINLDVEDTELREYIRGETYTLRTRTLTDETINEDHDIEVFTRFRVDAEILGI